MRRVFGATLIVCCISAAVPALPAGGRGAGGAEQEAAARDSYRKAYELVLAEKWTDAVKAIQSHLAAYPKGSTAVAAGFWLCYSKEKAGQPLESAFECYREFVTKYPESDWADDARNQMVRMAHDLAKAGRPEFEAVVKSMPSAGSEEVSLAALYALQDMGDPEALKTIIGLYDKSTKPGLREKIIYVLADFDTPAAADKLTAIALKDPDPALRTKAVYALADAGHASSGKLALILKQATDAATRKAALYALGETRDESVVAALAEVARTEKDAAVAQAAAMALADMGTTAAAEALAAIAATAPAATVRKSALMSLADSGSSKAIPVLKQVAMTDADASVRQVALAVLADMPDASAGEALMSAFQSATDGRTQEMALHAIADREGEKIDEFLAATATNHADERIARAAVHALADRAHKGAATLLLAISTKSRHETVRDSAIYAIVDSAEPQIVVQALDGALAAERDPERRVRMVTALGETGHDTAVPILLRIAQKDSFVRVQRAAVMALQEIGSAAARDALRQVLENEALQQ